MNNTRFEKIKTDTLILLAQNANDNPYQLTNVTFNDINPNTSTILIEGGIVEIYNITMGDIKQYNIQEGPNQGICILA